MVQPVEQKERFGIAYPGKLGPQIASPSAVAQSVEAGAGLAGGGARSGGAESVGAPGGQRSRRELGRAA